MKEKDIAKCKQNINPMNILQNKHCKVIAS